MLLYGMKGDKMKNYNRLEFRTRKKQLELNKKIKHVETYNQYLIRLACLPEETNPIQYLPTAFWVEPVSMDDLPYCVVSGS